MALQPVRKVTGKWRDVNKRRKRDDRTSVRRRAGKRGQCSWAQAARRTLLSSRVHDARSAEAAPVLQQPPLSICLLHTMHHLNLPSPLLALRLCPCQPGPKTFMLGIRKDEGDSPITSVTSSPQSWLRAQLSTSTIR